ncbi:hypothetical protein [Rossellomorea marisflavi]|uniref:hypothetical protein n=1 Tax=Rossellomorea marisflavi TaxID=189381 RepID=UPI00345C7049
MKVKIITHSGSTYETEVQSYDPVQLNEDINSMQINTVLIGDVIVSKIDVKGVLIVTEEPVSTEDTVPEEVEQEEPNQI